MSIVEVKSDVSGIVRSIDVSVGQQVEVGQALIIVESMKMEMPICASAAGMVESIAIKEEEVVEEGQVILRITLTK